MPKNDANIDYLDVAEIDDALTDSTEIKSRASSILIYDAKELPDVLGTPTLEKVLADKYPPPYTRNSFIDHIRDINAMGEIFFLDEIHKYKTFFGSNNDSRSYQEKRLDYIKKMEDILNKFINGGTRFQIGISEETRNNLSSRIKIIFNEKVSND
jgi:hypothetical protein